MFARHITLSFKGVDPTHHCVAATRRAVSSLLVRVKDVVLRLHSRMARAAAVREAFGVRRELVRRSIVVEHCVSHPPPFFGNLLLSFSTTKTSARWSGTSSTKG